MSLPEQIKLVDQERKRCQRVHDYLQQEFGDRHMPRLSQELRHQIRLAEAIVTSLKELQRLQ